MNEVQPLPVAPKVSVLVPNYNHAAFLRQRLDSILNQTYQDFEVIILDDCSTDNSQEIIEQYRAHAKVSGAYYNSENSGSTFKQWQKGVDLAKGEWIWIAESDDWCEPNFLEVMMNGLTKNKICAVGYCQTYVIVDDDTIQWRTDAGKILEYRRGADFIANHLIYVCEIVNASAAVWRKELFYAITKEFATYKSCGDWLFWFELALKGDVMVCGRHLNYFRKHGTNVTEPALKSGLAFAEAIRMGAYLRQQGMIDATDHQKFIQFRYERFREYEPQMEAGKAKEISALFSSYPVRTKWETKRFVSGLKRNLRGYYQRVLGH